MNTRKREEIVERMAIKWNKSHGVEWPYGYDDASARARQLAGWNGRKRIVCGRVGGES